MSLFSG